MINFKDRVVSTPNRYRVSKISEDLVELIPETGTITEEGTILNRSNMMAIQGLGNCETVFNSDGSIVSTYGDGSTDTTVFNEDGTITETFLNGESVIVKTITFNLDGSISEVIL